MADSSLITLRYRLLNEEQLRQVKFQIIELRQSDFKYGSYLITQSGIYKLMYDIDFNPNSLQQMQTEGIPTLGIKPDSMLTPYDTGVNEPHPVQFSEYHHIVTSVDISSKNKLCFSPRAFGIGFFAAIVVQANDVTVDLNGHTLKQSAEHALQQRFYANIELANQPFIPSQGPHNFGSGLIPASNCCIKNGHLDRASHHGIHGNNNNNILLLNLTLKNYEIAGISMNGFTNLVMDNCHLMGQATNIPVKGLFSSGRFIRLYLNQIASHLVSLKVAGEFKPAYRIKKELRQALNTTYEGILYNRTWWTDRDQLITNMFGDRVNPGEYYRLFTNLSGSSDILPSGITDKQCLSDGNCYGIVLNGPGFAVEGFATGIEHPGRNAYLYNVKIEKVHGNVTEIPALMASDGSAQLDPIGATVQLLNDYQGELLSMDPRRRYTGDIVCNTQMLVAKYADLIKHLDMSRSSISPNILQWVESYNSLPRSQRFICNGDSMFHVCKGVIGLRMDNVTNIIIENSVIRSIINHGNPGIDINGEYQKDHPKQTLNRYNGASTRGISISSCNQILIVKTRIEQCQSINSECIGIDVMFASADCRFDQCLINDIKTGNSPTVSLNPNNPCRGCSAKHQVCEGDCQTFNIRVASTCRRIYS